MTLIYNQNLTEDTIAAISTAPGMAAISIIRISGEDAIKLSNSFFSGPVDKYKSHTVHFGKIIDKKNNVIDSVLLTVMLGPKSYTGENSVEISCHGGTLVTKKVYETIIQSGIRQANPGEFTFRSFMNDKIDLLQAEAVQELISANNEKALHSAEKQLEGSLSLTISKIQIELTEIAAIIEAWVDFPEEGLEFATKEEIREKLTKINDKLKSLSDSFHEGKILFEGINLAIIGTPNVGKSSLMNILCKKDRAIVTHIAGTTRDTIEEKIAIGSLHFNIIDTAGIRETDEAIEEEGIKRSKKIFKEADIILLVLDSTSDISEDSYSLINQIMPEKTIIICNKIDIKKPTFKLDHKNIAYISAKENIGIDTLKKQIEDLIWENTPPSKEEAILTKIRHKNAIDETITFCDAAIDGINTDLSAEFIAEDMRSCLNILSSILGQDVTEDILSSIFSKFCVGK